MSRMILHQMQRHQQAREQPASPGRTFVTIRNPDDIALNGRLQTATLELNNSDRPTSTQKQFDGKILEYQDFCKKCYPDDMHKHVLNSEKMYRFMFYQTFREKKPRGGTKASRCEGPTFNKAEYDRIMSCFIPRDGGAGFSMDPSFFPTPRRFCCR